MKRTEIKYVNLPDGTIKILEINNVASLADIEENYGRKVAGKYVDYYPYYLSYGHETVQLRRNSGDVLPTDVLKPGFIRTKEQFSGIVAALKAAGNRLSEIIKTAPKEPQEKTILI